MVYLFDTFGKDITFADETDRHVTVSSYTNKVAMEQFAKNYSPDVEILESQSLREKIIDNLKKSMECYG